MEITRRYETSLPAGSFTVEDNEDETRFFLLKGYADADFRVRFTVEAPIGETYIMLPACLYDGNRFERVERAYPPMFTEAEMGLEVPVRMTEVPALEAAGDSYVDVTTGDLATPGACLWSRAGRGLYTLPLPPSCWAFADECQWMAVFLLQPIYQPS